MTLLSRLILAAANSRRTIRSSSPWQSATLGENGRRTMQHANLGSEPKKSFIYTKTKLSAEPNEPQEPKEPKPVTDRSHTPNEPINSLQTNNQLGSFYHPPIQIAVPSPTSPQISSISSSVTAIHPCVQSPSICTPSGKPWIMMSPPGSTPASRARATSAASGYEICSDKWYLLRAFRRSMVYRPSGVRPSPSVRLAPTGSPPSATWYVRSTLSPRNSTISRFCLLTSTKSARKTPHRIP